MIRATKGMLMGRWGQIVRGLFVVGVVAFGLTACSDSESTNDTALDKLPTRTLIPATPTVTAVAITQEPTPTDLPAPSALMTPMPPETREFDMPQGARAQIERATADLAAVLEVAPSTIHLVSLEALVWRDASWGCAALADDADSPAETTRGYRIILEADGQYSVYHTDETNEVRLCPDPDWLALEGRPIALDPIAESIVSQARTDAARRLGVDSSLIHAVSLVAVTWPDGSLGCPKVGINYDSVLTRGYRIVLEAPSARAIYHTSIRDLVWCMPEEEILPGALREALPGSAPEATPAT